MRAFLIISLLTLLAFQSYSQQLGLNYQAILRNSAGELISSQGVLMRVAFEQESVQVYREEHIVNSDLYGQISFVIGQGTILNGSFEDINWANKDAVIFVEMFHNGSWVQLSSHGFQSVAYAFYADKAGHSTLADSAETAAYAHTAGNAEYTDYSPKSDTSNYAYEAGKAETASAFDGDRLSIGINSQVNSSTFLTIRGTNAGNGYNGMYIMSPEASGRPFYGFAGPEKTAYSWIYHDPAVERMRFYVSGNKLSIGSSGVYVENLSSGIVTSNALGLLQSNNKLQFAGNGAVINGTSQVNTSTLFTIHTDQSGYGGMYVNSPANTDSPFYGYAVNGSPKAWHYYSDGNWHLYNGGNRLTAYKTGAIGINKADPTADLHIKQRPYSQITNRTDNSPYTYRHSGIRIEHADGDWMAIHMSTEGGFMFHSSFTPNNAALVHIDPYTGAYEQGSDSTLKCNIRNIESISSRVKKLRPMQYNYKADINSPVYGFLAQDVLEIFPNMVGTMEGDKLTLDYSQFAAIAIKGIQEQQEKIDELESSQEKLLAEIEALKILLSQ